MIFCIPDGIICETSTTSYPKYFVGELVVKVWLDAKLRRFGVIK